MKEIRGVVSIIFCTFVKICRALYARLAFPSGQRPAGVPRPGDSRGRGSLAAGLPRRGAPSPPAPAPAVAVRSRRAWKSLSPTHRTRSLLGRLTSAMWCGPLSGLRGGTHFRPEHSACVRTPVCSPGTGPRGCGYVGAFTNEPGPAVPLHAVPAYFLKGNGRALHNRKVGFRS